MQNVVKKYVGLDKLAEELISRLGDIRAAYVIGDYAKGSDSGLIDLVLVGQVDDEKLKEMTTKTEKLINRKIRTLVLDLSDLEKLNSTLDINSTTKTMFCPFPPKHISSVFLKNYPSLS